MALPIERNRRNGNNKKLGKALNIKFTPMSLFSIQSRVNKSRAKLSDIQLDAKKHRQDHLDLVAQNYAEQNNLSKHQAIL